MSGVLIACLYLALAVVFACIALRVRVVPAGIVAMVLAFMAIHAMPYDDDHLLPYLAVLVIACLAGTVASFAIVPRRIHH